LQPAPHFVSAAFYFLVNRHGTKILLKFAIEKNIIYPIIIKESGQIFNFKNNYSISKNNMKNKQFQNIIA